MAPPGLRMARLSGGHTRRAATKMVDHVSATRACRPRPAATVVTPPPIAEGPSTVEATPCQRPAADEPYAHTLSAVAQSASHTAVASHTGTRTRANEKRGAVMLFTAMPQ